MALGEVLFAIMGGLSLLAAWYVLTFRPVGRPAALLAAALCANGAGTIVLAFMEAGLVFRLLMVVTDASAIAFLALFPTRVRSASLSFTTLVLAAGLSASTLVWLLGGIPVANEALERLLLPGGIGMAAATGLLILARYVELGDSREPIARAARLLYLVPIVVVAVNGGTLAMQVVTGALGLSDFPVFLYTTTELPVALLRALGWWGVPLAIIGYTLARPRWPVPALLFVAGAVSGLPLFLIPEIHEEARVAVQAWGLGLTPMLVMYAQARYHAFPGEARFVATTTVVAGATAFLAYLLAFVAGISVIPGELGLVTAAALGFAAALVTARVALPLAQHEEMRRLLDPSEALSDGARLAPGHVLLGRYRVRRFLTEGGQARVFEAEDRKRGGARVVLKALASETAVAEARILQRVQHENVIRLIDVVEVTGVTLLVLEYAGGGDLRGLLSRSGGRLPPLEAAVIAQGVLAGLAAAHAIGVAHRDVKPENVLLDDAGTPKLTDFGAAREAQPGATARVGGLGTLAYLAPEQVRGDPGDARADVYATGVLMHELFTGARPISTDGRDDFLVRRAIVTETPRIALAPEAAHLAPFLERALEKDPAARFANAGAMRDALQMALAPAGGPATPPAKPEASDGTV